MTALSASLEDYLEAIYWISDEKQAARAKDISKRLGVNNSSVSGALRALSERGLVNYAPYDLVTLTPEGRTIAVDVVRRHEALRDFFIKVLAVDVKIADAGACKMEHEIPAEILERFILFVEFMESCPRSGVRWFREFGYACQSSPEDEPGENCGRCAALEKLEDVKKERSSAIKKLSDMQTGERGRVVRIGGEGELHKRLVDMGMVSGSVVAVERVAPLGDPMDVKLRGYHLSLRKDEANLVDVNLLQEVNA
jgi:DtxR family Mn-dependent transcriptional regulator